MAKASTQAVTPEPQLVTTARDPSTPAAAKIASSASGGSSLPSGPATEETGTFAAPGMCPEGRVARGSGAVPRIAARDLLAGVPAIAQVARFEARQLGMVPSPSLDFDDVQRALDAARDAVGS